MESMTSWASGAAMWEAVTPSSLATSLNTGIGGSMLRSALGLYFATGGGIGTREAGGWRENELRCQQDEDEGEDASRERPQGMPGHKSIVTYQNFFFGRNGSREVFTSVRKAGNRTFLAPCLQFSRAVRRLWRTRAGPLPSFPWRGTNGPAGNGHRVARDRVSPRARARQGPPDIFSDPKEWRRCPRRLSECRL